MFAQIGADAIFRQKIHFPTKLFFQIYFDTRQIQETGLIWKGDDQVHVAPLVLFSTCERSENAHMLRSMLFGDSENSRSDFGETWRFWQLPPGLSCASRGGFLCWHILQGTRKVYHTPMQFSRIHGGNIMASYYVHRYRKKDREFHL
jgi:hypothetical protein